MRRKDRKRLDRAIETMHLARIDSVSIRVSGPYSIEPDFAYGEFVVDVRFQNYGGSFAAFSSCFNSASNGVNKKNAQKFASTIVARIYDAFGAGYISLRELHYQGFDSKDKLLSFLDKNMHTLVGCQVQHPSFGNGTTCVSFQR